MRVLIAPQELKGTLTAREAATAIATGLRRARPDCELDVLPLADGGPGTIEALVEATGGSYAEADVHDPLERIVRARWGVLGDKATAVIEMAAASGLSLLRAEQRDPRRASTFGSGELMRAALEAGYRQLIVGAGGSATNDGGAGAAQALGARLLDSTETELRPGGAALARLARIDASPLDPRVAESDVVIATDVTNPLCGPDGASLVYGPQKGASAAVARELDEALAHYAVVIERDLGVSIADVPGAGAAGGLGAGLIAFCGARVRPGFDVVADAVDLARRIEGVDAVVTGEGRIDRQTAFGKTTAGVARMAREAGKPVIALAGSVDGGGDAFDSVFALTDFATIDEAMTNASELLAKAAERAGAWLTAR